MKTTSSQHNRHSRKIDTLAQQLLKIENELNSNIPATLWISDLHGEGDRFKSILRGRFGMLFQTCKEALPKTVSISKIQYLAKTIRKSRYLHDKQIVMDPQDVILCLVQILKYKLANIRSPIRDLFLPEFKNTIKRLLTDLPVPNAIFEEPLLSQRLIAHLAYTIRKSLLDHILVLGDVFDRGSQPDKILRILSSPAYKPMVDYVFGNHDILWMGAAAGNRSLIAEAMRISCRYDNFDLLDRLHFDSSKLAAFAERTYPPTTIPKTFKAKTNHGLSMEKALVVIQFKLEEETIGNHPEYEMKNRCWLTRLAHTLKSGDTKELNDSHFPTIDLDNPARLSSEEEEIISDLERQFTTNSKLKRLLGYLFTSGKAHHVHNNSLNIHALVPATKDGEFETFLGHSGKGLLDFIGDTIKRTGQRYLASSSQNDDDLDLFFYLWCGPKSPFFGKHAMKTFERYFLVNKERHKERTLHWKSNLKTKRFKDKLQKEFDVNRVVFGHTPVNYSKGDKMASADGVAINIDGGFAAAYYNRGHALVQTPHQLYGIILPTPEEMKKAAQNLDSAPLNIELIDEFQKPMKVKDTKAGQYLKQQSKEILQTIRDLTPNTDTI